MEFVKEGMGHGNLPLEVYSQVWEECYEKILFVPNQNRYTHGKYLSKKERLEYLEKRLEVRSTSLLTLLSRVIP